MSESNLFTWLLLKEVYDRLSEKYETGSGIEFIEYVNDVADAWTEIMFPYQYSAYYYFKDKQRMGLLRIKINIMNFKRG